MRLIGLTGLPRAGKGTFAGIAERYGFYEMNFSDPLKEAAAVLLNRPLWQCRGEKDFDREAIMPEWNFSMREFLQKLGTECMRDTIRQDFWVHLMRNQLDRAPLSRNVVITDVRFPNEVQMIRSRGGTVVGIERPGLKANDHVSNRPLVPDFLLLNDGGLVEFEARCHALLASHYL